MLAAMDLLPMTTPVANVRGVPFVIAQHASAAQQVLVTDADSYKKPGVVRRIIQEGLGQNLFTAEDADWLTRRKTVSPVFALHNVEALADTMAATTAQAAQHWQAGDLDIQDAVTDLTIRIALRGLLGATNETADVAADVRREFEEILDWVAYRLNNPASLPATVPTGRNRRHRAALGRMQASIAKLIEYRQANDDGSLDILSQLVRAQQDDSTNLTDEAIVDECIGFMFAGHETTAATLTWALFELSQYPTLQAEVAAEGSRLLQAGSGELVETVQSMQRTSGVIEEALRLYPAGISIVRTARRATELEGTKVRRGTMVMIPVYAMQRSSLVWQSPNDFNPTRNHADAGAGFLPFGLGPRRCLGARFARTEMHIALGLICATWQMSYTQNTPPKPIVAPSLRADGGLTLHLKQRT